MGYLNEIRAVPAAERPAGEPAEPGADTAQPTTKRIEFELNIGRNLVLGIVIVALIVATVLLYGSNHDDAARTFVDLVVALIAGGLGVNVGERAGASEAARKLGDGQ